jgi:hypothetical protein
VIATPHPDFAIGDPVYLRGAPFGVPGRILRRERGGKLAVLWADLGPSYIGRHRPETLTQAPRRRAEQAEEQTFENNTEEKMSHG